MKISYLQYCNEHEFLTFIFDDDTGKCYEFTYDSTTNTHQVLDMDHDPRLHFDFDSELSEFESLLQTDDFDMLSGDNDELDIIKQFINSGCITGTYVSSIVYPPKSYAPEVLMYWEHYQELGGKLIDDIDSYDYYFNLFYMLTQNKVCGDCPIPSPVGFDHFGKIVKSMCKYSGRKLNSNREYNIFFSSFDDIHAYS